MDALDLGAIYESYEEKDGRGQAAYDQIYLDYVGRDSLYGYLAQNRQQLFRDEDFASLYCLDNGRTSVPPSLAISLLLLRAVEGVSFAEAIERSKYDLRWKVALGLEMEEVPMQKSTLQEFEAKLVLHERGEGLLKKSIEEARRAGYLKNRKIRVALDTTPILGKGAVKDTYNLLAEGIEQLACRLAEVEGESGAAWAERQGLSRYFGSSLKGEAAIDWDDKETTRGVVDGDRAGCPAAAGLGRAGAGGPCGAGGSDCRGGRVAAAVDRAGCGGEAGGRLPDQIGDGKGPLE